MQISRFWLKRTYPTDDYQDEFENNVSNQPDDLHRFAWTFRLVNVILHSIVTQLFAYILINQLSIDVQTAFIASIHFAIHPIHTEAVIIFLALFFSQ